MSYVMMGERFASLWGIGVQLICHALWEGSAVFFVRPCNMGRFCV